MNQKIYTLIVCFFIVTLTAFAQTEKVKYPYYSSKLLFQNGMEMEGIILETNDSSFYLIQQKDWRKIKGKERDLTALQEIMKKKGVEEWPHLELAYRGLEMVETKKRKGQSDIRWAGLGLGVIFGVIVTSWANSIGCGDDNPDGDCNPNEGIVRNGLIMGGIGYGIGSLFSIRFPKKLIDKEREGKKWQESLMKYSILR